MNGPKLYGNCAFPQNFHNRQLGENLVFYAVFLIIIDSTVLPKGFGIAVFSTLSPNLEKPNSAMLYIIVKLGCLISCVTVREWFISISEILPQEEDGSEKKSSMSYNIDEDLKSHGSSTFDAISSSTTATSLVDSTVEANINQSRGCQDEQ